MDPDISLQVQPIVTLKLHQPTKQYFFLRNKQMNLCGFFRIHCSQTQMETPATTCERQHNLWDWEGLRHGRSSTNYQPTMILRKPGNRSSADSSWWKTGMQSERLFYLAWTKETRVVCHIPRGFVFAMWKMCARMTCLGMVHVKGMGWHFCGAFMNKRTLTFQMSLSCLIRDQSNWNTEHRLKISFSSAKWIHAKYWGSNW